MVATAGHSSESKNVALWDTLLPQKKSLIVGKLNLEIICEFDVGKNVIQC